MKGYKLLHHSVLDRDMQRLCSGSRAFCERMIENMEWRGTTIVTVYQPLPKKKKLKPKPIATPTQNVAVEKKQIIRAVHRNGTVSEFDTKEEASQFFNVREVTIYKAINRRRVSHNGPLKDWLLYETEKEVE